jgi:hypothetical protein
MYIQYVRRTGVCKRCISGSKIANISCYFLFYLNRVCYKKDTKIPLISVEHVFRICYFFCFWIVCNTVFSDVDYNLLHAFA